jgi:hypothetical protein
MSALGFDSLTFIATHAERVGISESHATSSKYFFGIKFKKIVLRWHRTNAAECLTIDDMSHHEVATFRRTTTVKEARQMHPAVGRSRLYAALRQGHIRSSKVGKRIAIDVVDLDRWVMAGAPTESAGSEKDLNMSR